ncbi:asparagine synthase (glutamine-hydrolysing) [Methylobacterium sp. 174MFSha1.1]|uniref:asparagine synthase (glutamine-hydrolyzing) n=1 Tax=Methylobacterium sp. 174MFSha1.1 TaxID=1502749 RepID=UPI0008F12064|nr:asparagine synthase (glutamine-hydrolyzing) [Methylobacterium sp. 174MFSha1.1]SFU47149.1 asparagine synthase (glutamine-hydrolysing) [Methylobacterium sp. 174MFSha1.1]
MCGLNGILAYHPAAPQPAEAELLRTRERMAARGPDGAGLWWSDDRRCGLAHRRLAILDLSEHGAQPMLSACGDLAVVFNGEIYNYPALRTALERDGVTMASGSDTEVLLHLYRRHGPLMVERLRGMFALAIWDRRRRGLFLARDPYGIKPLYTADDGWTVRFASQVKALLAGGAVSRDPEPAGIVGFHLFGSVPEPFTLYREIRALPAGHTQWVDRAGPREPVPYGCVAARLAEGAARPAAPGEAASRLRAACLDSVRAHLLADVDVGLFLSAGIDSGALLGLMRDAGCARVTAVTLGFCDFAGRPEDEVPWAARMAASYGARHVVRRVGEAEFRDDLPRLLDAMDQPSIDGVNTWFVAKAAREAGLKVALSGLGGDEILAGYPSFDDVPRWAARFRIPAGIPGLGRALRRAGRALGIAPGMPKAVGLVEYAGSVAGAYFLRRALFLPFELPELIDPGTVRAGLRRLDPVRRLGAGLSPDPGLPLARVAVLESTHYLRNQLLRDADWAGMAHGLEIRTPLVDASLLAALAPLVGGFGNGAGKRALAQAPSRPLPPALLDRPKTGFTTPIGRWLGRPDAARRPAGLVARDWSRQVFASAALPPLVPDAA